MGTNHAETMGHELGHADELQVCHHFQDFVEHDGLPSPDGNGGHGTAVTGIIAAQSNNSMGITGLCWDCRIMCLRFIKGNRGKITDQIAALDYAVSNKARISNNSYGAYG